MTPLTPAPAAPAGGPDSPRQGVLAQRAHWWGVVRRKAAVGLGVSLLVHVCGLLVAAWITVGLAQAGGAGEKGSGEIELAVLTEAELAELTSGDLSGDAPQIPDAPLEALSTDVPLETSLESAVSELGDAAEIGDIGERLAGGGDIGGEGMGEGGAGRGATTFFGVEARGTRFAYVVDVSGSMSVGGKIEALREQLVGSINALLENAAFFVAAFNTDAYPLGGEVKWTDASDEGKAKATRAVSGVTGDGGTEPLPAFRMVFSLRPRPDAIYFMTDGEFDAIVEVEVRRLNLEWKVPIHCIAFVSNASEEMMKRIARDSGGTYTYVRGIGP